MTLEISAKDIRDHKRANRFTGESIMLNAEEAKRHDELFIAEAIATAEDKKLGTGWCL